MTGGARSRVIESAISTILRTGVAVSIAVIMTGIIVTFVNHPDYFSSRPALGRLIDARANYLAPFSSIIDGTLHRRGQSIVMLGVLVLIATPVVRVAVSIVLFVAENDRLYVAITSIVLLLLIVSFMIGPAD